MLFRSPLGIETVYKDEELLCVHGYPERLTLGKTYNVVSEDIYNSNTVAIMDDIGRKVWYLKNRFVLVKDRPQELKTYLPEDKRTTEVEPIADMVNNPSHYTSGGIETIDFLEAKMSCEEVIGYLKGNVLKYLSRAGKKNDDVEDYKKAQWYLNRLVKNVEKCKK